MNDYITQYPVKLLLVEDHDSRLFRAHHRVPKTGIVYEVISKEDCEGPDKMEAFISRLIAEKGVGCWLDHEYFINMRNRSIAVVSRRPGADRPPVGLLGY